MTYLRRRHPEVVLFLQVLPNKGREATGKGHLLPEQGFRPSQHLPAILAPEFINCSGYLLNMAKR